MRDDTEYDEVTMMGGGTAVIYNGGNDGGYDGGTRAKLVDPLGGDDEEL